MDKIQTCPACGRHLAPDAPQGVCPECLMAAGLVTEIGNAGRPRFIPPKPEEIAASFPQLEILGFIGQGGMGAVYKARQKQLDRVVALKILPPQSASDPGFADRFTREARALAKLNHPGIVTIHDFGQADGLFYFLMEFVDGVTLRQLLNTGRISSREALAIVPQICDALQYAHDQGIVHRDIKPENILLDRRGRVKVADFGLAKLVAEGNEAAASGFATSGSATLTESGKIMGTPQYMAPEQKTNSAEVDHRADIYSLGVVFYQMLTGQLPSGKIEPPSKRVQIDVRLDEVVLRALEEKPELRYQQASVLKTQVETIAESEKPEFQSPASKIQPRFSRTRKTMTIGLGSLAVVGLLVWAIVVRLGIEKTRDSELGTAALTRADFHWLVFEADAPLVERLIPDGERRRGVQSNAEAYLKYSGGGFSRTVNTATNSFKVSIRNDPETDSWLAEISPEILAALLNGIGVKPGLLADGKQTISGVWWPEGMATIWSYSRQDGGVQTPDVQYWGGNGAVNLSVRQHDGKREIRIEGRVGHQTDPNEMFGTTSKFLYEGMAPQNGALAFLVPFFRKDDSEHYLVVVYEIGQKPGRGAKLTAMSNPAFGPVMERLLRPAADDKSQCFLDLDSGLFVDPPQNVRLCMTQRFESGVSKIVDRDGWTLDDHRIFNWARKSGTDVMVANVFQGNLGTVAIYGGLVATVPVPPFGSFDKANPDIVLRQVAATAREIKRSGQPPPAFTEIGVGPGAYAFQTREGSAGILEVLGTTKDPDGVKIRYRLVQNATTIPSVVASNLLGPITGDAQLHQKLVGKWNILDADSTNSLTFNSDGSFSSTVDGGHGIWIVRDGLLTAVENGPNGDNETDKIARIDDREMILQEVGSGDVTRFHKQQ